MPGAENVISKINSNQNKPIALRRSNDKLYKKRSQKMKILEIPDLPIEILEAINQDRFAVFVGAGVSKLLDCHSWPQLAENLVSRCAKEVLPSSNPTDKKHLLTYREVELIRKENPKKIITICKNILVNNSLQHIYEEELHKSLRYRNEAANPNIYDEIYSLRGINLTTNADAHFGKLFGEKNIFFRPENFDANNISRANLYHLHGSISDPTTLIFTVPDYLKLYSNPRFTSFLKEVFDRYTVLFIGYGLDELEILEYLITKVSSNPKLVRNHILLGLFSGDENILAHEISYYRELGINVTAYQKDIQGYKQLYEVLKG